MTFVQRHRSGLVAVLLAPALLAACGGSHQLVAPITDTTAAPAGTSSPSTSADGGAASAADSPSAAGSVVAVPAVTTRRVAYGQFDVAVQGVQVGAVDPGSFGDPTVTPAPSQDTYAFLKVTVHNRLAFASGFVGFDEVALDLGDGTAIPMDRGLGKAVDVVDPGATNSGWFVYPVPAGATFDGAKLIFGKVGFEQETLPLTGTVPAPAFPRPVTLRSPGSFTAPGTGTTGKFTVTITSASLTNAAAFDRDGRSEVPNRALAGHRTLYFEYTAKLLAQVNGGGATFPYDSVRLSINGEIQSGAPLVSNSFNLQLGETHRDVYVFDVPTTGTVALVWGKEKVAVPVPVA